MKKTVLAWIYALCVLLLPVTALAEIPSAESGAVEPSWGFHRRVVKVDTTPARAAEHFSAPHAEPLVPPKQKLIAQLASSGSPTIVVPEVRLDREAVKQAVVHWEGERGINPPSNWLRAEGGQSLLDSEAAKMADAMTVPPTQLVVVVSQNAVAIRVGGTTQLIPVEVLSLPPADVHLSLDGLADKIKANYLKGELPACVAVDGANGRAFILTDHASITSIEQPMLDSIPLPHTTMKPVGKKKKVNVAMAKPR